MPPTMLTKTATQKTGNPEEPPVKYYGGNFVASRGLASRSVVALWWLCVSVCGGSVVALSWCFIGGSVGLFWWFPRGRARPFPSFVRAVVNLLRAVSTPVGLPPYRGRNASVMPPTAMRALARARPQATALDFWPWVSGGVSFFFVGLWCICR